MMIKALQVMTDQSDAGSSKRFKTKSFLKKLGFYGFLFFLIKGLLWLIVPAVLLYWGFGTD